MSPLFVACSAALLVSCGSPLPTEAGPDAVVQATSVPATARPGCAEVEVTLLGRDRVSARFPAPEACEGGLVLARAGDVRYDRPGGGTLELPVAVRNATAEKVALPARLLLAPDSVVVLLPSGLQEKPHKRPVARNADGVEPEGEPMAGAWWWSIGEDGVLEAGASSSSRTVAFTVPDGVQRLRLTFRVEAEGAALDTIWPEPREISEFGGIFRLLDTTRVVSAQSGNADAEVYFRTEVWVLFRPEVTATDKAAFFRRHGLQVLGVETNGRFWVRMSDPGPSIEDFYARIDTLRSAHETYLVVPISRYGGHPVIQGRFPDDASGQQRQDWLTAAPSTWAMRAVRAPLAWGCETGAYGGPLARVGVVEYKHQPAHPDLDPSLRRFWEPPDLPDAPRLPPSAIDTLQAHGTAVSGVLAAQGDNDAGTAGIIWNSALHLYALVSPGGTGVHMEANFPALASEFVSDDLRVLNLSSDVRVDASTRPDDIEQRVRLLSSMMQSDLLDRVSGLLIVVSAGNDALRRGVAEYARDPKAHILRAALLLLRTNPAYADRVVLVAGVDIGNALWAESNAYTAATDIAAPAVAVKTLSRWTGQSGGAIPITEWSGTSFSAPLVAGTAGLLLSMDPTLTAAEVKDYIVRGAAWPRYRPETGRIEAPPEVSGLAGVRQLDAYGALSLLSNERKGTPLCGVRVEVGGGGLVLDRTGVSGGERLQLAGVDRVAYPSVAQGGRRIAVTDWGAEHVKVFDHQGRPLHEVADVWVRQFLERDTADIQWPDDGVLPRYLRRQVVRIRGPRQPETTLDPAALVTSWPTRLMPTVRVSMDGKRVAFDLLAADYDFLGGNPTSVAFTYGAYLVGLDGQGLVTVERTACVQVEVDGQVSGCEAIEPILGLTASWDHDSRRVTLAFSEYLGEDGSRTRMRRLTATGAQESSSTLQDREVHSLQTTADDQVVAGLEVDGSGDDCYLTWRAVSPLGDLVEHRRIGDGDAEPCGQWSGGVNHSINTARILDFSVALGAPGAARPDARRRPVDPGR